MAAADGPAELHPTPSLDQVVVTAGSNQLLHLVADTLLDPGDIVLAAAPSYFVFMATLANVVRGRWAWKSTPRACAPRHWRKNWIAGTRPANWPA